MLVVIDRADKDVHEDKFYLINTPNKELIIKWIDEEIPDGFDVIGRVVMCTVPLMPSMRSAPTGFLEEDDDEE